VPRSAAAALAAPAARTHDTRLRVVDVAMFYGERSGGIRTYLEAKATYAKRTGCFEHHLIVPGRTEDASPITISNGDAHRHVHRSLRLAASNGYRVPIGNAGLNTTLRSLRPDIVMLHDPYWTTRWASRTAHEVGATVIAVHHSSAALHAAGLPGPQGVYTKALRRWYRRAYTEVDALMSVVDTDVDVQRPASLPLRLGLDQAFTPRPDVAQQDHVLYVGRMSREKGVQELLEAAAIATSNWPLTLVGTGPMGDTLAEKARTLKLADRVTFAPYIGDRDELAAAYAAARCVVLPGAHETFGLAALEAAACGAAVVTADCTPSAQLLGAQVHMFQAGDPADLARAIDRARTRERDFTAARMVVARHGWDAAIEAELADLRRLLGHVL
jgi:alpha-1,6-mannosyltransferase